MSTDKAPNSPVSSDSPGDSVEFLDAASSESGSDDNDEKQEQLENDFVSTSRDNAYSKSKTFEMVPSILAGMKSKRSALRVDSWIDCALTLDGRDKITKFFQYSARLLAWYYVGTTQASRFASVKSSLVSSRKAYRLGRSIIELHRLGQIFDKKKKGSINGLLLKMLNSVRLLGLAGFWGLDNISFLAASGMWDNFRLNAKARASRKKSIQSRASVWANRSYFVGSFAGLWINLKALQAFRKENESKFQDASDEDRKELQSKYFGLCIALLKSVCDVLVFSNNPGLDFWQKYTGAKLNEGIHCIAGLTSASVVLYKNFPEA